MKSAALDTGTLMADWKKKTPPGTRRSHTQAVSRALSGPSRQLPEDWMRFW